MMKCFEQNKNKSEEYYKNQILAYLRTFEDTINYLSLKELKKRYQKLVEADNLE